jgi:hypothetical protein
MPIKESKLFIPIPPRRVFYWADAKAIAQSFIGRAADQRENLLARGEFLQRIGRTVARQRDRFLWRV